MSLFNKSVSMVIDKVPPQAIAVFAKKYIAGPTLNDAIRTTKKLNAEGAMTTIDVLGEFVSTKEETWHFRDLAIKVLEAIDQHKLNANLSLKLTQMGLKLSKALCLENIEMIFEKAKELGIFVRIDMEDSTCVDDTLEIYRNYRDRYNIGTVLQAYMRRTIDDIHRLSDGRLNFRLCKGIYDEPREIAYKEKDIVRDNYIWALETLFEKKAYVGIATHDEYLVFHAERLIRKYGLNRDDYEFQMLLGVDEQLRKIIINNGHRLRVYVPFGKDWLPYSIRRLKENPNIIKSALEGYMK
ncbi:proline dehydrogenase family protein [Hippea jasoniae]|uniref:proline dehydrogenase family protein n=1 Tax=Hippea jasoniae TaxID=944479 RepID=UPI000558159B|nr:proline dehydrogenase family protein [Hippea jasoniae]